MFVLSSDITIGSFHFSGVHKVSISKSIHTFVETATISLPSVCKIMKNGRSSNQSVVTGEQFADGDKVTIKLGYNGQMNEEFSGFVKRRNLDMPLEVECEGYSWQLSRNKINGFWPNTSVKEMLETACSGTDITVNVDYNASLQNIQANNLTGAQLIDLVKKATDNNLVVFFTGPGKLWAGILYTSVAQGTDVLNIAQVNYRLGFNAIKDNSLQQRTLNDDPLQVNYVKKADDGKILSENSDPLIDALRKYRKFLNHIASSTDLKALADEKQNKENYIGYQGHMHAFLQPFASPGCLANITDARYKDVDGLYLVESTELIYGMNGARRTLEIGPRLGFAKLTS